MKQKKRHELVAVDGDKFIGCSSGLAQKINDQYDEYLFK